MRGTTGRRVLHKHFPVIGDNVWVGADRTLMGPTKVEDRVVIAPNTVVMNSVPSGKIVAENLARSVRDVSSLGYNVSCNPKHN